jgi:hypothetical protein
MQVLRQLGLAACTAPVKAMASMAAINILIMDRVSSRFPNRVVRSLADNAARANIRRRAHVGIWPPVDESTP